jgi:hypothetical protein
VAEVSDFSSGFAQGLELDLEALDDSLGVGHEAGVGGDAARPGRRKPRLP